MTKDEDNQDQYDAYQAQDKVDANERAAVGSNYLDPDIDVNRSALSKEVSLIFAGKYTIYPLEMPGNLNRVWWLVHNDVQRLVKTLEGNLSELERMKIELEEKVNELKDYKWMYEELQ